MKPIVASTLIAIGLLASVGSSVSAADFIAERLHEQLRIVGR